MNVDQLSNDPRFLCLIRRRRRLSWGLALLIVLAGLAFSVASLYLPNMMMQSIVIGSGITLGFVLTEALVLLALAVCTTYAWYMNARLSRLIDELVEQVDQ